MFSKYLIYNKHKVNLNFIYLLRNRLLILICEILKRKKILLARRHVDVEDKKIASTIEKYIAIKI
jgi:hypothetical protein